MNIYVILYLLVSVCKETNGYGDVIRLLNHDLEEFMSHFIRYQNYKHVHLLRRYSESPASPSSFNSSWERRILKYLYTIILNTGAYVGVVSKLNISAEGPGFQKVRSFPQGSFHPGNPQEPRTLYVAPLVMDEHYKDFKKVMAEGKITKQPWLLICYNSIPVAIRDIYLPLDNRIFFAVLNQSRDSQSRPSGIDIWEVYQAGPHLPQRHQLLQRWSPLRIASRTATKKEVDEVKEEGKMEEEVFLFSREPWSRRSNLDGLHIRCTTIEENTYISGAERRNGSLYLTGIYGDLWRLFQEKLNFTSTCVAPPDGRWGSLHEGQWTGAIGQVYRGEADIAIAPFAFTYERAQAVTYLHSITIFWYSMMMKRETSADQMWSNYTRVFTPGSWVGVVVWAMAITLVLYFVALLSPCQPKVSLIDALFVSVSALCNQGYDKIDLRSTSSRTVFVTIYGTMILISTYYTCFLISTLTVEIPNVPFRDFQGLYNARQRYTFGFLGGTATVEYFEHSQIPLYRAIWKDMVLKDPLNLADDDIQLRKALEGRHVTLSVSYRKQEEECQGVVHLPGAYFVSRAAWTVSKNSPLAPLFNYYLRKSVESGIYNKFSRQWKSQQPQCDVNNNINPIHLRQVLSGHVLLLIGLFFALIINGLENIFVYRGKARCKTR